MILPLIRRKNYFWVLACSLPLLSACATAPTASELIQQRAQARWDTLLSGDLAGAYAFLSPGFRSSVPSLQYQRSILSKPVHWTGAKYIKSECAEITCKVTILLDYNVRGALPGVKSFASSQEVTESWVRVDGQWYLVPEQ